MSEIEFKGELHTIPAGAALVLKVDRLLSDEQRRRLQEQCTKALPGRQMLVIERGMDVTALDRLPVVSMDTASGPDQTAVAEIVKDAHGKQYITVVNNLFASLADPNSRLSRVMKAGVAREFVRIAGGKSCSDQGEGLGAKPAGEDPMEAARALVKKHGGGSGG